MTARRRRRNGPGSKNAAGVALIALAGAAIISALIGFYIVNANKPVLDQLSLCDQSGPSALTAILIDATDPISPIQRASIANRVTALTSEIALGERIDVFEIRDADRVLEPRMGLCRPASSSEVSELTGNKEMAHRRFEERFESPLLQTFEDLLSQPEKDRSPIMEAIQGAAIASVTKWPTAKERRLIIISDMLENGAGGVHYRGVPSFINFKSGPSFQRVRANLAGTKVEIWYLRREDAISIQGRSHITFWNEYFAEQGASLERVVQIEGVN